MPAAGGGGSGAGQLYKIWLNDVEQTSLFLLEKLVFPGDTHPAYASGLLVSYDGNNVPSLGDVMYIEMPAGEYSAPDYYVVFNGLVTKVEKVKEGGLTGQGVYRVEATSRLSIFRQSYINYRFGQGDNNLNDDMNSLLSDGVLNAPSGSGGDTIDGLNYYVNNTLNNIVIEGKYENVVGAFLDGLAEKMAVFFGTLPNTNGELLAGVVPVVLDYGSGTTTPDYVGSLDVRSDGWVDYGGSSKDKYTGVIVKAITRPVKYDEVLQVGSDKKVTLSYASEGYPKVYYLGDSYDENDVSGSEKFELCYGHDFEIDAQNSTENNTVLEFFPPDIEIENKYVHVIYFAKKVVYGKAGSVGKVKYKVETNFGTINDSDLQDKVNRLASNMLAGLSAGEHDVKFKQPSAFNGKYNILLSEGFHLGGGTTVFHAILPGGRVNYTDMGGNTVVMYLRRAEWHKGVWTFYLKPLASLVNEVNVFIEQDRMIKGLQVSIVASSVGTIGSGGNKDIPYTEPQPV